MPVEDWLKIAAGLFTAAGVGLLGYRTSNKARHENASDSRESRFQDNLQKRHDAVLEQNDRLRAENGEIPLLKRQLYERDRVIKNLLDSLDAEQQKNARRWAPQSAFAPLEDPKDRG